MEDVNTSAQTLMEALNVPVNQDMILVVMVQLVLVCTNTVHSSDASGLNTGEAEQWDGRGNCPPPKFV